MESILVDLISSGIDNASVVLVVYLFIRRIPTIGEVKTMLNEVDIKVTCTGV